MLPKLMNRLDNLGKTITLVKKTNTVATRLYKYFKRFNYDNFEFGM